MIETINLKNGIVLFLPLCPSTNSRMMPVRMGRYCREILTPDARDYIRNVGFTLKIWTKTQKFIPLNSYTYVDLWFILPRTNCDAHNYGKVLFDALEEGNIVTNDKFILPRIMGVSHDAKCPQIALKLPKGG